MKRILLINVVLLMSVFAMAQQDQKAKDILDKVSEKTNSFSSFSAEFTFTMENKEMEIDEKNVGSIKLKGQKYILDLPEVGMKIFSDGTTLWNYSAEGKQVTISNLDDEESDLTNPSALFKIYEKGFNSKYIGEKVKSGIKVYEIELFPDSDEYDVSKITIFINKSTMYIQSADLMGTDGNLYGIEVKKMDTNTNLADKDFVFDSSKYGDIDEIDFR